MTKRNTKHVVLSATLALVAALSACSKPGDAVQSRKAETAPSPVADPGKAAVENKANEDKIKAEAEGANATPEAKAAKTLKAEQLEASLDKMSQDIKADLEASKIAINTDAANVATKAKLDAPGIPDDLTSKPVASVPGLTDAAKTGESAPATTTAQASAPAAPEAPAIASNPELAPAAGVTVVAAAPVPAPAATEPASLIDAEKRALIISLIKPSMVFNFQYGKNRRYIEDVQKLAATQPSAVKADAYKRVLKELSLKDTASFEDVLARVDMINVSFIVPLLFVDAADKLADAKTNRAILSAAMAKLNVSEKDEDVRFRTMRAQMRKSGLPISSLDLMKAYFGTSSEAAMTETQRQTLVLVKDVMKVLAEPEAQKEISEVEAKLKAQIDIFAAEKEAEQVTRP